MALMTARQKLSRLDILMQWASLKWEASVQCARMLAACAEEEQALVAAARRVVMCWMVPRLDWEREDFVGF